MQLEALRASLDMYGKPNWRKEQVSFVRRATRHRQIQALIAFVILIMAQGMWFFGDSNLRSLIKPPAVESELLQPVWQPFVAERLALLKAPSAEPSASPSARPSAQPFASPSAQPSVLASPADTKSYVEYILWALQRQDTAEGLWRWISTFDPFHLLGAIRPAPSPDEWFVNTPVPTPLVVWQDSVFAESKCLDDLLQQLILPPLYGCLGAMAYVLRTLSQQAKAREYRTENDIIWDLQIFLGVLAGLAIGWFLKPSGVDTTGINLASPLALAFVAGYSVDLLFTAMDRIVAAFSGRDSLREAVPSAAAQPPTQEQPKPPTQGQPKPPTQKQA